jgi:putative transposase
MSDLCKEYGISRQTGYKFFKRFKENGFGGLEDLSRRPHASPHKIDPFIEELIIDIKGKYPTLGPKKLKTRLENLYPKLSIPAASTIGAVLSRNGLVNSHKRRIKRSYSPAHLTDGSKPNEIWCIDYKGQFKTKDRKYCYPLTISDYYSRFLIACDAAHSTKQQEAFEVFKESFKEFGLPDIIRSDNGIPFASSSHLYGLSRLSVWFLSLCINLERIDPGHPEQNGRHERMHRTLKNDAINPPADNILQQQEKFNTFLDIYNNERPHEALGQKTPGSLYIKSNKLYQEKTLEYPNHDFEKRIDDKGILWIDNMRPVKIGKVLHGYMVGIKEMSDEWLVTFSKYDLGIIKKETLTFESMESIEC